jgi:hypothetical protein
MRRQLLDRARMQSARPWPAPGWQTQRLRRGAVLGDDDHLGRRRQRAPQPEQRELSEPILNAGAEQIGAQQ